jgi:hypothetical protein
MKDFAIIRKEDMQSYPDLSFVVFISPSRQMPE